MSDKKLSQSEINSWFEMAKGQQGEKLEALMKERGNENPKLKVYDFNRPDKFSQENLKSLEFISNVFTRNLSQALSTTIGSPINVMLSDENSIEQIPYGSEYIEKMPIDWNVFCIIDMGNEQVGEMIIEVDLAFARYMQRKLISRRGVTLDEVRKKLTDLEEKLLRNWVGGTVLEHLETAFQSILPLEMRIAAIENEVKYIKITTPQDMVALISFQVEVEGKTSSMRMCIPYLSIQNIIDKMTTENVDEFLFVSGNKEEEEKMIRQNLEQLERNVEVDLGRTKISLERLMNLDEGDYITLGRVKDGLVGYIEGKPKFSAQVGKSEGRLAARVSSFAKKGEGETNG